ncbi:MAG: LCP family protein [Lachnospiraceae bacterium]
MFKKVMIGIVLILICTVGTGALYIYSKLNKINTEELDSENLIVNEEAEDLGEGYSTFAIFGVDSREGEMEEGVRSDCIIIVNLNNETKEVQLISVYRDTLLDMTDGELHKCNSAFSYGGADQAVNMLNMNLDLNISEYITVDFTAVAEAIDLLGGIEIDVKEEEIEYINDYLAETAAITGKTAIQIETSGTQVLDGVQATTYARIRSTAGGDFTRTQRQREVIEKMLEKAKQSDLSTLNKIIDELLPGIKTSFSAKEIINYARFFAEYEFVESAGFPIEKTPVQITGIGSTVIPVTLETNVIKLHEMLYKTENYRVSSKVAEISRKIEDLSGQHEAQSNEEIYNQYYEDLEEDRQQEKGIK